MVHGTIMGTGKEMNTEPEISQKREQVAITMMINLKSVNVYGLSKVSNMWSQHLKHNFWFKVLNSVNYGRRPFTEKTQSVIVKLN